MKPWKQKQITRVRETVAHLRNTPHGRTCRCCQISFDAIEQAADAPCAIHHVSLLGMIAAQVAAPTYPEE